MATDNIAKVVDLLRTNKYDKHPNPQIKRQAEIGLDEGPIVDMTNIYTDLVDNPREIWNMTEDHPCVTPPWPSAMLAYENHHGNVVVAHLYTKEFPPEERKAHWDPQIVRRLDQEGLVLSEGQRNEVDWDRVRWVVRMNLFAGNRGGGKPMPTRGPLFQFFLGLYEDGSIADIHWQQIVPGSESEEWDMPLYTVLGSLNFLNCRNVELVEPQRPRADARRIARHGNRSISEINVFPTGKSTVRTGNKGESKGVPLTSVRGHFATYGEEYGKGLLFGRLSGRFWIPQYARGSKDQGEIEEQVFNLKGA